MNKIDTDILKSQIKLRDLAGRYTTLAGQDEQYGPCPKCKGADRFHVTDSWFFCRQCHPDWGDCIEFAMWLNGQDFQAACEWLANGNLPTLAESPGPQSRPKKRPNLIPTTEKWQARARSFISYSQKLLWQPEGRPGLDYLLGRDLTEETIKAAGLGFNPKDRNDSPEKWGVTGKEQIWLPGPGIVIPWLIEGQPWRVNIRLLQPRIFKNKNGKEEEIKYIGPSGWAGANPLFNADSVHPARPVILVEGEFCALTICQEAGDLITAVATGSTESSRATKWIARLAACPLVLVSFDAEPDKGDKAARFWLEMLPNAKRWRPLLKDVNDMHRAGISVRDWLKAGLPAVSESKADSGLPARWVDPVLAQSILSEFKKGNPLATWPIRLWWPTGYDAQGIWFNNETELRAAVINSVCGNYQIEANQ